MGRIHRKIEALEKAAYTRRKACQEFANRILETLSVDETELLISAFGARQAGRELSASESAARRVYTQAWELKFRAGQQSATRFEHRDYIYQAIVRALECRVTLERLELVRDAMECGGELSAAESEAVGVYVSALEQLSRLAGFASAAEFELFSRRTAGGEQ